MTYYYHSTFASNLNSIHEKGLIPNFHRYWKDSKEGYLYFSTNEEVTADMTMIAEECTNEEFDSGIITFKIPETAFNLSLMEVDTNITEESRDEYQCYIYPLPISPEFLKDYSFEPTN